jgi:hypothetical protein
MDFNKFMLCFAVLQSSIDEFFEEYKEHYGENCHPKVDMVYQALKEDIFENNPLIQRDNLMAILSDSVFTEYLGQNSDVDEEIIEQVKILSNDMYE